MASTRLALVGTADRELVTLLNPPLVVEAKLLGIDVAGELAVK
jgi:hypothetical protein